MNFEVAEKALSHSIHSVVVTVNNEAVAMGRIVGDGHKGLTGIFGVVPISINVEK